jgi:type IV secretory pathway TrbL component
MRSLTILTVLDWLLPLLRLVPLPPLLPGIAAGCVLGRAVAGGGNISTTAMARTASYLAMQVK